MPLLFSFQLLRKNCQHLSFLTIKAHLIFCSLTSYMLHKVDACELCPKRKLKMHICKYKNVKNFQIVYLVSKFSSSEMHSTRIIWAFVLTFSLNVPLNVISGNKIFETIFNIEFLKQKSFMKFFQLFFLFQNMINATKNISVSTQQRPNTGHWHKSEIQVKA